MSTKSTVIQTENNEDIYFDCSNQFSINGEPADELTFEFSRKNIRIDAIDDDYLCFSLHRDSQIYRYLVRAIEAEKKVKL